MHWSGNEAVTDMSEEPTIHLTTFPEHEVCSGCDSSVPFADT